VLFPLPTWPFMGRIPSLSSLCTVLLFEYPQ
jgi:hypothetical protein